MNIKGVGSPQVNDIKSRENLQKTEKVDVDAGKNAAAPEKSGDSGDKVVLSSQAQNIRKVEQQLAKLPDVDNERVEKIKKALDDGSYQINSRSVAEKLLNFEQDF
ncbi:flagellar biosynthesis anti-sigma factor FlgM [Hahella sp. KA22]|uniref:flagellar biosynthesis anti-sigma factor FlgM n=1 Tax=Hahella sp. KA22 TaxID=1628392 RepID=UPI000FDE02A8|nr:flagellar biosynthesis anti-sigma factor FlgM [Hahella sp. KA22]AZZ91379.1 flagellar biosynthesis anti-sigma factor FlgM [Hahella sp. KA22]QAY54749.1 flagellar biosynthesis anti-sigma factor FlgM [Hahella sp. KA22]